MKLTPHLCPECGAPAVSITETVLISPPIEVYDDGEADWNGDEASETCWDTTEPAVDAEGKVDISCGMHSWKAVLE